MRVPDGSILSPRRINIGLSQLEKNPMQRSPVKATLREWNNYVSVEGVITGGMYFFSRETWAQSVDRCLWSVGRVNDSTWYATGDTVRPVFLKSRFFNGNPGPRYITVAVLHIVVLLFVKVFWRTLIVQRTTVRNLLALFTTACCIGERQVIRRCHIWSNITNRGKWALTIKQSEFRGRLYRSVMR